MLGVFIAVVAVAAVALTYQHHEGYFGPAFADRGRSVVYAQRNTSGLVWGLGWEFFTPPAHTLILDDRVSLRRLDPATGRVSVIRQWPRSPIVGRVVSEYRGRSFAILGASIEADSADRIEYAVGLSIPRVPSSEQFRIQGAWSEPSGARDAGWESGEPRSSVSSPVLNGDVEVMIARGRESFPAAIMAYESRAHTARVLHHNGAYGKLYPRGVPLAMLEEQSRRAGIERADTVRLVLAEQVARFRAEGHSENDAQLRAIHEMELLGYYPRSPYVVARRLAPGDAARDTVPVFDITDDQIKVGLFQDLDRAMTTPGEQVDFWGDYPVHRDYTTSQQLNEFIDKGGRVFRVSRGVALYEITLVRR